jgi:hypothetical protein
LGGSLARADQQEAYLTLMTAWLRYFLNGECVEALYTDYVTSHSFVVADPLASCMLCGNVDDSKEIGMRMMPNPSNGSFEVQWREEAFLQMEILDVTGKNILCEKVLQQYLVKVNEALPSGIYLVKLSNEKSIVTQKLIVN